MGRAVRSIIRLIAFGAIIFSVCLLASDFYLYLSHKPFNGPAMLVLKGLPFLAGVILLWKSSDIAQHLTQDLD